MFESGIHAAIFTVDAFVALTAVSAGMALATGLQGDRFPVDLLKGTPFSSYVIPGLILAVVVGGSAAVAAVALLLLSPNTGGWLSGLAGAILMGWIFGEVLILRQPFPRKVRGVVFYFALGLTMAFPALVMALTR